VQTPTKDEKALVPWPAVAFDIDGVLADSWPSRHLIHRDDPKWELFYESCESFKPCPVVDLIPMLHYFGLELIFITTRPARYEAKTRRWLELNTAGRFPFQLLMYPGKEVEPCDAAKQWKIDTLVELSEKYDLRLVFEDDPQVIRGLKIVGLPVVPIFSGYYSWRVPS